MDIVWVTSGVEVADALCPEVQGPLQLPGRRSDRPVPATRSRSAPTAASFTWLYSPPFQAAHEPTIPRQEVTCHHLPVVFT